MTLQTCSGSGCLSEPRILDVEECVHFGMYMAGTRELSSFEEDLRNLADGEEDLSSTRGKCQ